MPVRALLHPPMPTLLLLLNAPQATRLAESKQPLRFVEALQAPWRFGLLATILIWGASAGAQPVYRVVGPDGKVTFTDRPPADTKAAQGVPVATGGASPSTEPQAEANVPAALKPVVRKYPITLYTAASCAPCDQGRSLLRQRGVPFTEKTVNTTSDHAAFQKLAPNASGFPLLMVGAQAVAGYSASDWNGYLDAAGYPKTSALPASYQHPPAQPLAPPKPVDPNASAPTAGSSGSAEASSPPEGATQRRPRLATPPKRNDENPAGIKF